MAKKLQGEVRIMEDDNSKEYMLTFTLVEQEVSTSLILSAADADCEKEVKQLVSKLMQYKPV